MQHDQQRLEASLRKARSEVNGRRRFPGAAFLVENRDATGALDRVAHFTKSGASATEPVSYTHLDVYKRQTPEGVPLPGRRLRAR